MNKIIICIVLGLSITLLTGIFPRVDLESQIDYGFPFVYYTTFNAPVDEIIQWTYIVDYPMFILDFIIWVFISFILFVTIAKIKRVMKK